MAILTEKKIKNIVFNHIENATAEELKAMLLKIKERFYLDMIKKRAKHSLLKSLKNAGYKPLTAGEKHAN